MHTRVMLRYHFLFVFIRLVSPSRILLVKQFFSSFAPLPAPCTKYRGLGSQGSGTCARPAQAPGPRQAQVHVLVPGTHNSGLRAGTNKKCPDAHVPTARSSASYPEWDRNKIGRENCIWQKEKTLRGGVAGGRSTAVCRAGKKHQTCPLLLVE